jgi:hypothetical protein
VNAKHAKALLDSFTGVEFVNVELKSPLLGYLGMNFCADTLGVLLLCAIMMMLVLVCSLDVQQYHAVIKHAGGLQAQ